MNALAIVIALVIGAYFVGVFTGWAAFRCRPWTGR